MIIATRKLTAVCKSGVKKPVVLRLEAPREENGRWACWPAQTTRSFAAGADQMHAIQMGLMKLGTEIHFTSYHKEHKLSWGDSEEGSYGLIVPKNARDLLRGDDITYYGK